MYWPIFMRIKGSSISPVEIKRQDRVQNTTVSVTTTHSLVIIIRDWHTANTQDNSLIMPTETTNIIIRIFPHKCTSLRCLNSCILPFTQTVSLHPSGLSFLWNKTVKNTLGLNCVLTVVKTLRYWRYFTIINFKPLYFV